MGWYVSVSYTHLDVYKRQISPAGNIARNSPAARYLSENGIDYQEFNSYGSRRGNHEVMMRGTFANIRIKNELVEGKIGGYTKYEGDILPIYDAAMKYKEANRDTLVIAGKDYGCLLYTSGCKRL